MKTLRQQGFIRTIILVAGIVFVLVYVFQHFLTPPSDFPAPYHLTIEKGQTLFSISHELQADRAIRSPRLFELFMIAFGNEKDVSEGEYYFTKPVSVFEIALRVSGRKFGIERRKVTFPEGFNRREMAARLGEVFPDFDTQLFLDLSLDDEGYLFPDTYGFFPSVTADVVVTTLRQNFARKIAPYTAEVAASGKKETDIITMASIIEKEASGTEDRAVIAGILWKRLKEGIPLQVDAPFLYTIGKDSDQLSREDVATNSPYNTYINKGLPPTPIGNPGLAAFLSALRPTESPYYYYLHGADRQIHYARTYAEHQKNIKLYLSNKR